jgi:hypothetical protein
MSKATIVFVHGLGGDPATTWGKFPDLIKADPELKDCEIVSFGYAALAAGAVTNTGLAYQEYSQPGPPVLQLTRSNSQAWLDWTPVAVKFLPEQNTNLSAATWSSLTVPPRAVGSDFTNLVALTNLAGFYRLHQP